jgi:hypothetical protein
LFPKLKNGVGFPFHVTIFMILGLPYTGNVPDLTLQFHLKDTNGSNLSHGKGEKNSTLREKLL